VNAQATKEISDWLEKLGMSEYAQRFAENKIDLSALRYLIKTSKISGLHSGIDARCWRPSRSMSARSKHRRSLR
jgi:SAM domain (Sterile alpha motif)